MRLHPVLRAESDQYDLSLTIIYSDDGGFLGDMLFADQPTALHDVAIRSISSLRVLGVTWYA